ncbi:MULTISPECIES: DnaB-like helicase C-terminal domain-containing protein [unclassified Lysinibacillus]|uniref:DnaB-like helicase C-terminal domain-containing protein n=1 Tax=unclassified Lysinibacillus TaxID=2636778 RepID=UPI002011E7EE|nr:DnaB-like helicase C-terminal domain-containing protein [Lysinibacillus sp. BPa_S21]MCL1696397.1 DNA helicase [Lysinibacillus sp. BPa_S21]MCL1700716.1 DNA helicase [Lysinibacillus sp. Bpr_S20]
MEELKKYPEQLVHSRNIIEASFVFCLWKNPELFDDYSDFNPSTELLLNDSKFYYSIGKQMKDLEYKSLDNASVFAHLKDNQLLAEEFSLKGGFKTVDKMCKILSLDNVESYYDTLTKSNMLINLYDKGFNVLSKLEKFKQMTTSQLYDYYEYQLDNVFLGRGSGVEIVDLDIPDDFVDRCNSGEERGLSYHSTSPLMNYHTMGLHRSNVQIFAGFSGTGKSSYVVNSYVMAILDAGESITIIANEMNIDAWRHLFLATVLSQKLNYFGLTRKKQKTGSYTDEQLAMIKEAQKYITENYKGRIKFVKIFDYSIDDVKRVIRKMAKRGFNYNIFDTFKSEDASSSNVTGELIEASKQLLQVAEKENVNITITMQLAIYMENTRYLTSATLSSAKAVKEVVSEVILMRKLWDDEYSGQKYDVKPWRYIRDSNGKITGSKEYLTLDPEKRYRIMFLDKTRNDDDDICVISRFDGAWNSWKEIGYCTPMHQNR